VTRFSVLTCFQHALQESCICDSWTESCRSFSKTYRLTSADECGTCTMGLPAHFSRVVRGYLDEHYPQRWIGRGSPVAWPPRSPDLNPLDFFLWGHLKSLVYATPVNTQQELWQRVWVACDTVKTSPGVLSVFVSPLFVVLEHM
jgi:hypothetical protein